MNVIAYQTANKRCLYSLPLRVFPNLVTNVFVIDDGDSLALVDCGSGTFHSNDDLLAGFATLQTRFGVKFTLADINTILITHGHIDHFGALPFVRQHNQHAQIGVHALDRAVLEHHNERATVAASRLRLFLEGTGISAEMHTQLMRVYLFGKSIYQSTPVQFELAENQPTLHNLIVHHVPGHCPGLVCLQVDDILLTADHILSHTTPHQAPESIVPNMGLGHYLHSLDKIRQLDGIRLGIGCHEDPMPDLHQRIDEIEQMHQNRLTRILELCQTPQTIAQISQHLFGDVKNYHILLALEEAGAHVEYLHQRGLLLAANLEEIEQNRNAVIQYVRGD